MNLTLPIPVRAGTLLAINLLYLMVWGFAGIGKLVAGMPSWFDGKFGKTFLATFPGLPATFWLLALAEVTAFGLAVAALIRLDFCRRSSPNLLSAMLVASLFVFVMLGFGQWLTGEFNGAFQQFVYFAGTLIALLVVNPAAVTPASAAAGHATTR